MRTLTRRGTIRARCRTARSGRALCLPWPGRCSTLFWRGCSIFAAVGLQGLPAGRQVEAGRIEAGSPAQKAGLQTGDIFLTVNGQPTAAAAAVSESVGAAAGAVVIRVQRGTEILRVTAVPHHGRIGVMLQERMIYNHDRLTVGAVAGYAASTLARMSGSVIEAFAMLVTGRARMRDFSGPVGMVNQVAVTATTGPGNLLLLLAFISVNLGLFNLFPYPRSTVAVCCCWGWKRPG